MSTTRNELAAALADIRRAYRLVQTYQRRLWDLLGRVDDALSHAGLPFKRWMPMNVWAPPKPGTRFFVDRWAWDFVPAYQIGCEWEQIEAERNVARRVFVIATADTGYDATSKGEPDPAAFKPPEECATMLRVGLWTAATRSPDWEEAVRERGGENKVREGQSYTLSVKGTKYTYQFFLLDVADLVDAATVKTTLLQPIEAWLAKTAP
jgi:hypothetical protein